MVNGEQYSLSNLRDIVVPEAPPFWPPAPGVWVALGIVMVVVGVACRLWFASRRRNAYRRAGIMFLENTGTVHDVSVVLKRVALAVFPRDQIASLHGRDWSAFLNQTCSRCQFSEIALVDYGDEIGKELIEQARTWILYHSAPAPGIHGGTLPPALRSNGPEGTLNP